MTSDMTLCETINTKFDETVFDFDLNLLEQSSIIINNVVNDKKIVKLRKALVTAKRKTIATDTLIRKYFARREQLEKNDNILFSAKEECKQVCIDYKNTLEKCSLLEKEAENYKHRHKDLESKLVLAQNQCDAYKSHAHQLQLLVKEHETKIEALVVEKQLVKNDGNLTQNATLQKGNEVFLRHIHMLKDVVLGKTKLEKKHRVILQKYGSKTNKKSIGEYNIPDCCSEDADSLITPSDLSIGSPEVKNVQDEMSLPDILQKHKKLKAKSYTNTESTDNCDFDDESDCSNNFISEDTGCGSSITFSDGEKCFNSPDYFMNDSPNEIVHAKNKKILTLVNTATSPHRTYERNEIATSPLIFDDEALLSDTTGISYNNTNTNSECEYFITDIPLSTEILTIKEKKKMVDVGTCSIYNVERVNKSTSPIVFIENTHATDNVRLHSISDPENDTSDCEEINETTNTSVTTQQCCAKLPTLSDLSSNHELEICEKSVVEKRCLEKHNSQNLLHESNSDEEIVMILNTMQLKHKRITPIPETPSLSRTKDDNNTMTEEHDKYQYVSSELAKINQDNKELHVSLTNLSKEVSSIKYLLMSRLPHVVVNTECNNQVNNEIYENTSQGTLIDNLNIKKRVCEKVIECSDTINTSELENAESSKIQEECAHDESMQYECHLDLTGDEDPPNVSSVGDHFSESPLLPDTRVAVPEANKDRIIFEEGPRIEIEDEITASPQDNFCKKNLIKRKKISKLDKLKHKLLPKYKISKATIPSKKKQRPKPKPLSTLRCNNKIEPSILLNNKSAYEKAIKVMSEVKSKEKKKTTYIKSNSFRKRVAEDSRPQGPQKTINKNSNIESATLRNRKLSTTMPLSVESINKNVIVEDNSKGNEVPVTSNDVVVSPSNDPQSVHVITTRSRRLRIESHEPENLPTECKKSERVYFTRKSMEKANNSGTTSPKLQNSRKQLKRVASESPEKICKRVLRSSNVKEMCNNNSSMQPLLLQVDTTKTNNIPKSIHNSPKSIYSGPILIHNSPKSIISSPKSIRSSFDGIHELKVVINPNEINDRLLSVRDVVRYIDFDANSNMDASSLDVRERKEIETKGKKTQHHGDLVEHIEVDRNIIKPVTSNANGKENLSSYPKNSILCHMIEKYGKTTVQYTANKVSDKISTSICKRLDDGISNIIQLHTDKNKPAMNKLVEDIRKMNFKSFITGFMMYLKDPARKRELFNKVNSPPAPTMTKQEQILLYIVKQLSASSSDAVNTILTNIEYSLFQLNRTPDFDVVESMSHFYALVCRYFGLKHRLRLFILDAMYCLQYKVIPIIKQCLEVWMHILPLAHMGIAKTPLVTCLIYLLHFYKCEDRFNRVQDIRFILSKKYFYQITDWNEKKILEMFKNAIKEVKDVSAEIKILRTALIILAKRLGAKWCQKNIIKNMLLPMIEEQVSDKTKRFCITMLGPLMKPFPADMKVHCEIVVNQLLDMLEQNPLDIMKEAIFTSLIYMNKHNQFRVTQALLQWEPKKVSREFEDLLCDFVREKPVKTWLKLLPKMV